jgi:TM2 domain-containing membrane protein YozV/RNA polymerase subunit RPABC4/transcription elongation factor Spt4
MAIDDVPDDDEGDSTPAASAGSAYCISCGEEISPDADICPECGVSQRKRPESGGPGRTADEKYCTSCGAVVNRDAELCPECGVEQTVGSGSDPDRVAAALLALLLGGIGAHKFYLGDTTMGVLYLCFFWTAIPAIIGLIEGIIYLTKTDEEFERQYGDAR